MTNNTKKTLLLLLLVALLSGVLFLPGMSRLPLLDRDEPRFAEAGRYMLATGDYLVPYFNNEVRYDKPPAIYWLMTLGYRTFGVNEIGARIGSALAGIISCLLVFFIAKSMYNLHVAAIAALAAPVTVLVFMESRIATADALLLLNILVMFWGMWRVQNGQRSLISFAMIYGALAAGSLTKGPVPLAVMMAACLSLGILRSPGLKYGIRRCITGSLREFVAILGEYRAGTGILVAAAIVMAWFVPAVVRTGGGFLTDGFYHHVIDRSFGPEAHESHDGIPVIYYLLLLPLTFFPWFAFLPSGLQTLRRQDAPARCFLLAWAIAPFIVFSFLRTKLPHYVMPGYPALIIISAVAISNAIQNDINIWKTIAGKIGLLAFLLVGFAIAASLAAAPVLLESPETLFPWLAPAIAAFVLTITAFTGFVRRRNMFGYVAILLLMGGVISLIIHLTLPSIERNYYMYRNVARDIIEADPANETVVALGRPEPSLVFYLNRENRRVIPGSRSSIDVLIEEYENIIFLARGDRGQMVAERGGVKIKDLPPCFNTAKMRWDRLSLWQTVSD